MAGLKRLTNSSKGVVGIVALALVVVLLALNLIEAETAVEAIKLIAVSYMGSTALEDGLAKLSKRLKLEDGDVKNLISIMMDALPHMMGNYETAKAWSQPKEKGQPKEKAST